MIPSEKAQTLGRWFLVLAAMISFIVLVGGVVRLSGSGLSIPDWPLIDGSLLPPMTRDGWMTVYRDYYLDVHKIDPLNLAGQTAQLMPFTQFRAMFAAEYFHRFVAAMVGVLFLALAVQIFRRKELRSRFGRRMVWMGLLLLIEGILGGIVVKLEIQADFLAVHLVIAFTLLALSLWTALDLFTGLSRPRNPKLHALAWTSLLALFLQILTGGLVAGTGAGYMLNTWPTMEGRWIPEQLWAAQHGWANLVQNPVLVQFLHRWWGFAAAALAFVLLFGALREELSPRARLALRSLASLVVFQVLLGIVTLLLNVQPVLASLHQVMAVLLVAALVVLTHEFRGRPA